MEERHHHHLLQRNSVDAECIARFAGMPPPANRLNCSVTCMADDHSLKFCGTLQQLTLMADSERHKGCQETFRQYSSVNTESLLA